MNDIKVYEQAFERIKDQLNDANQDAEKFKGPCIKCAHCVSDLVIFSEFRKFACQHPLVIMPEFDPRSGKIVSIHYPLGKLRKWDSVPKLCGEDRQLFEPSLFWPVIKAILSLTFLALVVFVFWPY
jgi:hypothetical protein